jgi:hypothetical protein
VSVTIKESIGKRASRSKRNALQKQASLLIGETSLWHISTNAAGEAQVYGHLVCRATANSRLRDACVNGHEFLSLADARAAIVAVVPLTSPDTAGFVRYHYQLSGAASRND